MSGPFTFYHGEITNAQLSMQGSKFIGFGQMAAVSFRDTEVSPGFYVFTGLLNDFCDPCALTATDLSIDGGSVVMDVLYPVPGNFGNDRFLVTDRVTLNNPELRLAFDSPSQHFTPTAGQSFTIIDNRGTEPVHGTFRDLSEGTVFSRPGGPTFRITYEGGTGNDVVLTVVGEPIPTLSNVALLLVAAVVALIAIRMIHP